MAKDGIFIDNLFLIIKMIETKNIKRLLIKSIYLLELELKLGYELGSKNNGEAQISVQ